jgi:ribosomal protein S16
VLQKERLNYWRSVGAIFSKAVTKLEEGKYEYVKYEPKKALAAKEEQAA